MAQNFESVDAYIRTFPPDVQSVLQAVRDTIHAAAPDAQESISYQIPTFSIGGRPVVYLAGWKKHISLYPLPELDETLKPQVAPYLSGRGTAKFLLAKPIPLQLITVLVERLVAQRG
ncbi:MAG TPA: DUF1801 domain-containing protein [Propionibacteriaceae bacterium]|nr:DUF1801 domain-containing protein [Propionibacteriaceae bacterium]